MSGCPQSVCPAVYGVLPYMLIVGERDIEAGNVAIRHREKGDLGPRPVEQFIADLKQEVDDRLLHPA